MRMKVLSTPGAESFVRERGGRLFVWTDRTRCCGGGTTLLETSLNKRKGDHDFHEYLGEGFVLHLDSGRLEPPDELHLAVKGWRHKRVDAFWNGCAYVEGSVVSPSPTRPPPGDGFGPPLTSA